MAEDAAPPSWQRRLLRGVGVAVVVALGVLVAANAYLLASTAGQIHDRVEKVPPRPVAVVLGGHITRGHPSLELAQRLTAARDLYRAGKVQRILISGLERPGYSEPDAMLRWLLSQGISADVITVDALGVRTMATMVRAASVFGVRAAVICTQAYHLPRALYLARKAGIDAVAIAADSDPYARQNLREVLARAAVLFETALFGLRADGVP
ncbi:MAG TPA: ElyC/SanA/YdcF family protein [Polyangia bacterium]|nr:ElyC/SanA/YdcF family protein [Polyangia bacterium]